MTTRLPVEFPKAGSEEGSIVHKGGAPIEELPAKRGHTLLEPDSVGEEEREFQEPIWKSDSEQSA